MNQEDKLPNKHDIIEIYHNSNGMYETIKVVKEKYIPKYPVKPTKPSGPNNNISNWTSNDFKEHAEKLATWEAQMKVYSEAFKKCKDIENSVNMLLEDFVKEMSNLITRVPEKYQDKVWAKAKSMSESDGLAIIYETLCSLVEIFE